MSNEYVERSTASIGRIEGLELVPHAMRLLAEGDADGRLVGLGLTLRPTPHRYLLDGRAVFAWCASDALTFPLVLGRPGIVESTCGPQAAAQWAGEHPEGQIRPVEEAFALDRAVVTQVGWAAR